jgi:hypothetical protein
VLGAHAHACTLASRHGRVIAVVTAGVGNGPLTIVVDDGPGIPAAVEIGMPAQADETMLRIGPLQVALAGAPVWEPRPDWAALRTRQAAVTAALPALRAEAVACAPNPGLLAHPASKKPDRSARGLAKTCQVSEQAINAAIRALQTAWAGDLAALDQAAAGLAGLGTGLTPAGDDFLAGAMLRAWLAHPSPEPWCHALAEAAAPRTSTLSAALLRAAARGECTAAWHALLQALATGSREAHLPALHSVLAHGATSGADMLAGFLWS